MSATEAAAVSSKDRTVRSRDGDDETEPMSTDVQLLTGLLPRPKSDSNHHHQSKKIRTDPNEQGKIHSYTNGFLLVVRSFCLESEWSSLCQFFCFGGGIIFYCLFLTWDYLPSQFISIYIHMYIRKPICP